MKKFIELFKIGYVVVPNALYTEFTNAAQAHGIYFCGGALLDDGAKIFYNDSPQKVRDICADILRDGSAIVPNKLCKAVENNLRVNHGALLLDMGAQVLYF